MIFGVLPAAIRNCVHVVRHLPRPRVNRATAIVTATRPRIRPRARQFIVALKCSVVALPLAGTPAPNASPIPVPPIPTAPDMRGPVSPFFRFGSEPILNSPYFAPNNQSGVTNVLPTPIIPPTTEVVPEKVPEPSSLWIAIFALLMITLACYIVLPDDA